MSDRLHIDTVWLDGLKCRLVLTAAVCDRFNERATTWYLPCRTTL
jgi:hypothetical protein